MALSMRPPNPTTVQLQLVYFQRPAQNRCTSVETLQNDSTSSACDHARLYPIDRCATHGRTCWRRLGAPPWGPAAAAPILFTETMHAFSVDMAMRLPRMTNEIVSTSSGALQYSHLMGMAMPLMLRWNRMILYLVLPASHPRAFWSYAALLKASGAHATWEQSEEQQKSVSAGSLCIILALQIIAGHARGCRESGVLRSSNIDSRGSESSLDLS